MSRAPRPRHARSIQWHASKHSDMAEYLWYDDTRSVSLDERFEIMEAVESRFGYKINIEFIGGRLLQGRAPRQRSEPRSPGASLGTYVCPHHPFGWLAYTLELERIPGIGTCNTRRHRATATSCAGQSGR